MSVEYRDLHAGPSGPPSMAPPGGVQALFQGHGLRAISAVVGSGFHVSLTAKTSHLHHEHEK